MDIVYVLVANCAPNLAPVSHLFWLILCSRAELLLRFPILLQVHFNFNERESNCAVWEEEEEVVEQPPYNIRKYLGTTKLPRRVLSRVVVVSWIRMVFRH